MSYNLYGWKALDQESWREPNVYKTIKNITPDILGAQETIKKDWEITRKIGWDYRVAGDGSGSGVKSGHAILYRTSKFKADGHGSEWLTTADWWEPRKVAWAHLTHHETQQKIDVFNTHLCLHCKCSESDYECKSRERLKTGKEIVNIIVANRRQGSRIILTGDFNCFGERSELMKYLKGEGNYRMALKDTFREINRDWNTNQCTFEGTWHGGRNPMKIDYVMVDKGTKVKNAYIYHFWETIYKTSDHWPVVAELQL